MLLLLLPSLAGGCSGRIPAPRTDASAASARAMAEYDRNGDGFLDAQELERCPGLKSCLGRLDRDGDGRLSQSELEDYLATYGRSRVGLAEVVCKVTLAGRPLAGASVVLEPEPFLGDGIKPARGTTDERGRARMQAEGAPKPGCHLGIYRVRISKTNGKGEETLPARYNRETRLGLEVGPSARGQNTAFHLSPGR